MSAHLSNEVVERFHAQRLSGTDKSEIYEHVLGCETCRERVVTPSVQNIAVDTLTGHLLPEPGDLFHLDAETIEAFVDDKLNPLDRSTAKLHLDCCVECSSEVTDLRESLATMKAMSQTDTATQVVSIRARHLSRLSMRIAAVVALVGFIAIAAMVIWKLKSSRPTPTPQLAGGAEPGSSPQIKLPALNPSPTPNTPHNAENPPSLAPPKDVVATIKDGPHQITVDQNGKADGLESLPADSRSAVARALTGEPIEAPEVLDELTTTNVSVRSANPTERPIVVVYPARTVIEENQPTLRWRATKNASSYQVSVSDENFRQVAKSELPAAASEWKMTAALERGHVYTWSVRTVNDQGQLSEVTSQGKFKVLSGDKLKELTGLKRSKSHLALGLFYAQEGIIDKATAELRMLFQENPDSEIARQLLNRIQSWRKR